MPMTNSALVLFSGGQDSTTCLAWALARFEHVETVGFDYGQRHRVELDCRMTLLKELRRIHPSWKDRLGNDHLLDLSVLGAISETALTSEAEIELTASGLPTTFVPGRNLLFLTLAAALAYRRKIGSIVGGMCETDFSGYPDCRQNTIKAMELALSLGMDTRLSVETPLMWLNKSQTWALAHELGGHDLFELIRTRSHTCYKGDRTIEHDWGFGCGECPACQLRANGFNAYRDGVVK